MSFDLEALRTDAGDMYDVLSQIVDAKDSGRLRGDIVVTHQGERVWLIEELARGLVEKHEERDHD